MTTRRGQHAGLGLHAAYNQVRKRLQGEISIECTEGAGTRVTVRIDG